MERHYAVPLIACGLVALGALISRASAVVQKFVHKSHAEEVLSEINHFTRGRDFSASLLLRIDKFVRHKLTTEANNFTLLDQLPFHMLGEMRLQQSEKYIMLNPLMEQILETSRACIRKVALSLKYEALEPTQPLISRGQITDGCYIRVDGRFLRFAGKNFEREKSRMTRVTSVLNRSHRFNDLKRIKRSSLYGVLPGLTELADEVCFNELAP